MSSKRLMIYLYKWKFFIAIVIAQRNQQIKNVKKINRKKKYQAKTGGTSALFLILWSSFLIEKKKNEKHCKIRRGKKCISNRKEKIQHFFFVYISVFISVLLNCVAITPMSKKKCRRCILGHSHSSSLGHWWEDSTVWMYCVHLGPVRSPLHHPLHDED